MTKEQREKIEALVYKTMDALDKTGSNTQYYREIFSKMSDSQFDKLIRSRLPFRFQTDVFNVEPEMSDVFDAFKVLKKPNGVFKKKPVPFFPLELILQIWVFVSSPNFIITSIGIAFG